MDPSGLREDLISSAVSFLQDPTVASSPLAKRLSFLESKGLTQSETDEALRRTSALSNPSLINPSPVRYSGRYANPREIERDWRDWFVMSVIGGGLGYLFTKLAKKYLVPALEPPSRSELEEAQARLEERYDEVSELLQSIRSDTETIRDEVKEQSQRLIETAKSVEIAVEECLSGEAKRDAEMLKVQEEIDALKEALPQMLEKNKEAQTSAILDLQTELKSLKSLLTVRTNPSNANSAPQSQSPSTSSSRAPQTGTVPGSFGLQPSASALSRFTTNRPIGIPAWQLAPQTNGNSPNNPTTNGDRLTSTPPPIPEPSAAESTLLGKPQEKFDIDSFVSNGESSMSSRSEKAPQRNEQPVDEDDDHIISSSYNMIDDLKTDPNAQKSSSFNNS